MLGTTHPTQPITNNRPPMHPTVLPPESQSSTPNLPGSGTNCSPETSRLLFDMDKLDIPLEDRLVFTAVNRAVITHMSQRIYDLSHDYEHIQRVVANALMILTSLSTSKSTSTSPSSPLHAAEEETSTSQPSLHGKAINRTVVYLACMVHDVADRKYTHFTNDPLPNPYAIAVLLLSCGATHGLADAVQLICDNHSYTHETASDENFARVRDLVRLHPELAVVQDADRLDTLGVVGQGRCWAYDGAHQLRRNTSIQRAVQHHWEKLVYLPGIMKTEIGRRVAEERWERMETLRRWWDVETDISSVV
ncbi:hypothetical protein P154DRAFT_561493 [Amniculicola lignicola CBS 123094]|uniref:HD/PDEase domain-containing protein n=1 Tax=Amniculicola lignicola CBS 123094 TaxID=1392246 RepID=A0A6A5WPL8_9PLEO|nr:hypothetical protein P154DRAFT_561493 [Amniculicola lignicola CBS 123094]